MFFKKVISNQKIDSEKLKKASEILIELQKETLIQIEQGKGPFLAAIYDENYNLIAKMANSVVEEQCSNNHAEMNAIKQAQGVLKTYDLAKHNLSLFVTSEPCIMCLGGIMWSGIKNLYYGVPSNVVEKITGFDEGFKPNWFKEFKKRGICVCGKIEQELGEKVLKSYIESGKEVYKPSR